MASSRNTSQFQDRGMKQRKITPQLKGKIQDIESSAQVDSGIDCLASLQSDRSNTESFSDDSSRDQKFGDSISVELVKQTEQLDIADDSGNGKSIDGSDSKKCDSTDFGYVSLPSMNFSSLSFNWMYECIRIFAQTQNLRYVLAPIWPTLLHRNDDGDT